MAITRDSSGIEFNIFLYAVGILFTLLVVFSLGYALATYQTYTLLQTGLVPSAEKGHIYWTIPVPTGKE